MNEHDELLDDPLPPPPVVPPPVLNVELNAAQEKQLLDLWNATPNNPPSLKQLAQAIFGADLDGRSLEGKAIKKALSKNNLKARTTGDPDRSGIELSEGHKAYIATNNKTMSTLEMAKVLFNNPHLTALHAECRAVQAYRTSLTPVPIFSPYREATVPTEPYSPPNTILEAMERVNHYINMTYDKEKLTQTHKKHLSMLISYLHTYRFMAQMNNYVSESNRTLAEDAFIRATFDKPDLAQEEIDQYIEYANQVVNGFNVQRRSEQLMQQLEDITVSNDESNKVSMSLVGAIEKASTEYHQCLGRQQKLLDDLKEKRSKRIEKQVKETASVLNLVQMWREEESRAELMAHAEKEQRLVGEEVERLSSLADIKARILGLTKDEIRYG